MDFFSKNLVVPRSKDNPLPPKSMFLKKMFLLNIVWKQCNNFIYNVNNNTNAAKLTKADFDQLISS